MLQGLVQPYSATQPHQSQVEAGHTGASTPLHQLRGDGLSSIYVNTSTA